MTFKMSGLSSVELLSSKNHFGKKSKFITAKIVLANKDQEALRYFFLKLNIL